jgi:RimJ/RimL family protein N-acetyltransferase
VSEPSPDPPARELIRIQAEALFTHDARGRISRVNEPGGARAPRFFLGRTAEGSEWRFRDDLDDAICRDIEAACRREPLGDEYLGAPYGLPIFEEMLARDAPIQRTEAGPAYRFPLELPTPANTVVVSSANADVLRPHLEPWLPDVAQQRLLVAYVRDGHAVSVCGSVRDHPRAHEAGVDTAPEFRGHGYAVHAVAAWAEAVRQLGRIPLYSTSWQNVASQAVARKLGLVRYGTDLHIT